MVLTKRTFATGLPFRLTTPVIFEKRHCFIVTAFAPDKKNILAIAKTAKLISKMVRKKENERNDFLASGNFTSLDE